VRGILADNDVEGYVRILQTIWLSETWRQLWIELGLSIESLASVGLSEESSDAVIWRTCQRERLALVTANRNADDPTSLELTIRAECTPESLPVITLANPQRLVGTVFTLKPSPSGFSTT